MGKIYSWGYSDSPASTAGTTFHLSLVEINRNKRGQNETTHCSLLAEVERERQ